MAISLTTEAAAAPKAPSRRHNARERKVLQTVQNQTASQQLNLAVVQAEIDFATSGNRTQADHGLGVSLPAGAIILGVSTKVTAHLTSASNNATVRLYVGPSSDNKPISAAITADGSNSQDYTCETAVGASISATKTLTVAVGTAAVTNTSGKVQYVVTYIVP